MQGVQNNFVSEIKYADLCRSRQHFMIREFKKLGSFSIDSGNGKENVT